MNIKLGSYEVLLKVIYKNNKNIYFRYDEDLSLVVTCPKHTLDSEIYKLIDSNEEILIKMYQKAVERKKYDEDFYYLGKKYNLIFDENIVEPIINEDSLTIKNEMELENFINSKIMEVFTEEADICKKCFNGLPDYSLKFRKMKTRWGVCNTKTKVITLNTELIKRDINLIDYVIIHEMAHFYEGNHSKRFWDIVGKACPNYKERRAALRK